MSKPYIRTMRSKTRPGRLKGDALAALRAQCFERDGYSCQHILARGTYASGFTWEDKCNHPVTWEGPMAGHMHHIRNKRMWGDNLENVTTLCSVCHVKIHNADGKPCPKKVL